MLSGIGDTAILQLPPYINGEALPKRLDYVLVSSPAAESYTGYVNTTDDDGNFANATLTLPAFTDFGSVKLTLTLHAAVGSGKPLASPLLTTVTVFVIPGALSLLPPLVTLALSVWLRQVVVALLTGIWVGATLLSGYNPAAGLLRTFDTYFVNAVTDGEHAGIVIFTLILGGLIETVARCKGGEGLAIVMERFTTTRVRAQLGTWLLGLMIFFDDYSSILIVGNSLRVVMPRMRVSTEKFAFLVHTMGVSLASFSPVSSWIGFEYGYVAQQYRLGDIYPFYLQCYVSVL